jgi:hypothetical protein
MITYSLAAFAVILAAPFPHHPKDKYDDFCNFAVFYSNGQMAEECECP